MGLREAHCCARVCAFLFQCARVSRMGGHHIGSVRFAIGGENPRLWCATEVAVTRIMPIRLPELSTGTSRWRRVVLLEPFDSRVDCPLTEAYNDASADIDDWN